MRRSGGWSRNQISVSLIVNRFYEISIEDDSRYIGSLYFPVSPDDEWTYSTGTMQVVDETRTFTDGTGRRFEADWVYMDSTHIMFIEYSGDHVVLFGRYDYEISDYTDDPVAGLATFLLDTMQVNEPWILDVDGPPGVLQLKFTLIGITDVTVPAGTFNDCLKIRFEHMESQEPYSDYLYFAANVGIVKAQRIAPVGATEGFFLLVDSSNRTSELQSATVAGIDYP